MNTTLEDLYQQHRPGLTPDEEGQLYSICVHEVAHSFVATRLGLESDELVVSRDAGVCVHRSGTPTQSAIIGIAGVMAEALLNAPHQSRTLPAIKLTNFTVRQWVDELKLHQLSSNDRKAIQAGPSKYHSADMCFAILDQNLETLEYLARSLANRSREKFLKCKDRPSSWNEWELNRFVREQNDKLDAAASAECLQQSMAEADTILESLPPCRIPDRFNYETFLASTGASEEEIIKYATWFKTRERNQIGLGPPPQKSVETTLAFLREHAVTTRGNWSFEAKRLFQFRDEKKGNK